MSNEYRDCPRCCPPPMRNPRAEIVGLILVFAWCVGWCVWFVQALAR